LHNTTAQPVEKPVEYGGKSDAQWHPPDLFRFEFRTTEKIAGDAGEGSLIRATDRTSAGFATTYAISKLAVAADVTPAQAASFQTLDRSQQLTGFRVLNQQTVLVNGQEAYQVSYVFVESDPDLTSADIPSVVRGMDYTFVKDGQAITVSYWADDQEFEAGLNLFNRFLSSVKF